MTTIPQPEAATGALDHPPGRVASQGPPVGGTPPRYWMVTAAALGAAGVSAAIASGPAAAWACLMAGAVSGLGQFAMVRGLAGLLARGHDGNRGGVALAAFVARHGVAALALFTLIVVGRAPAAWVLAGVSIPPLTLACAVLRAHGSARPLPAAARKA